MEENSSSVEVSGKTKQNEKNKNQIGTYKFKIHYLGKEINEVCSFHTLHLSTTSLCPAGFRKVSCAKKNYVGDSGAVYKL